MRFGCKETMSVVGEKHFTWQSLAGKIGMKGFQELVCMNCGNVLRPGYLSQFLNKERVDRIISLCNIMFYAAPFKIFSKHPLTAGNQDQFEPVIFSIVTDIKRQPVAPARIDVI